jgi:hypothetical protein
MLVEVTTPTTVWAVSTRCWLGTTMEVMANHSEAQILKEWKESKMVITTIDRKFFPLK